MFKSNPLPVTRLVIELKWAECEVMDELYHLASKGWCTIDSKGALTDIMRLSVIPTPFSSVGSGSLVTEIIIRLNRRGNTDGATMNAGGDPARERLQHGVDLFQKNDCLS